MRKERYLAPSSVIEKVMRLEASTPLHLVLRKATLMDPVMEQVKMSARASLRADLMVSSLESEEMRHLEMQKG